MLPNQEVEVKSDAHCVLRVVCAGALWAGRTTRQLRIRANAQREARRTCAVRSARYHLNVPGLTSYTSWYAPASSSGCQNPSCSLHRKS
jgi:hypothetical protein